MPAPGFGAPPSRSEILGFLLFSHGWTWGWWLVAALLAMGTGGTIWHMPAAAAFYLGGAGVFLGGIAMTLRVGGRSGIADLARRCVDPRLASPGWWLIVLAWYPALTFAAAALSALFGMHSPLDVSTAVARLADPAGLVVFLGFIMLIGPLPEEIGWRGFLLDRLLAGHGVLVASLFVALAWWSWHLPLGLLPGYFEAFSRQPDTLGQLASLIPTAIVYTWIYVSTRRSVLAVIIFHFMGNLTGQTLEPSDATRLVRLAMEAGAALLIVAFWKPESSLRR
jgi:uncharacterized protein